LIADLPLATLARKMREVVRDKSYRESRLGLEVGHFMRWQKFEFGATESTLRDYEAILAKLAIYYADKELSDFEPPEGTAMLREFLAHFWADRQPRTRAKVRSVLHTFFQWANGEFKLRGNPVDAIRRPKLRGVERRLFDVDQVVELIEGQPSLNDRVALRMMFEMALRKSELAGIQWRHIDSARRRVTVKGKGGKIIDAPIPSEELRQEIEALRLERRPDPNEYLLYQVKRGRVPQPGKFRISKDNPIGVLVEWKDKGLDPNGMQRWWRHRIETANVPYINMHAARHTAITDFLRQTGNLKLAQLYARHADISTTANVYGHLDVGDLEAALHRIHDEGPVRP
jgi:integrase/recombinase XerC